MALSLLLSALVLAVPLAPARAETWNGIAPGTSTQKDVVKRFGKPTKQLMEKGRQVYSYQGAQAIKGTKQANFYFNKKGVVEEIHVFPKAVVPADVVQSTFGKGFVKRLTDDFHTYYWYGKLGLVVFLNSDAKTVYSFIYTVPGATRG